MFAPGTGYVFLTASVAAAGAVLPCVWNSMTARSATSRSAAAWAVEAAALIPTLVVFAVMLPLLPFAYAALGSVVWPLSTVLLSVAALALMPLLAAAHPRARRVVIVGAGLIAVTGALATFILPTYSADWPERINFEYQLDADTGGAHWVAQSDSRRLPAQITRAAGFDPVPRPPLEGGASVRFYAPAPQLKLAAPPTQPRRAHCRRVLGGCRLSLRSVLAVSAGRARRMGDISGKRENQ